MKKRRRLKNEVSAGSMADIAFLLLIFFLVTTTIEIDQGISVLLPRLEAEPPRPIPPKNVLSVKINSANEILVEGELLQIAELKEEAKIFITNPEKLNTLPTLPKNAIISLQHDRGTQYESYIHVYNELKAAYNDLWNQEAIAQYGFSFKMLNSLQVDEIKKKIPFVISEAEPVDYASAEK